MEQMMVDLERIDPNPYQTREGEDKEHVAKIAASILANGLMQVPVARQVDGRVQLAFGHTRLAAYRLIHRTMQALASGQTIGFEDESPMALVVARADGVLESGREKGLELYGKMPVILRELTNEEMFQWGVRENSDRKDISPMEEARAMKRYRDEFGKNSAQIGELFGLSDAAVRNKMRLVDLPEETQALVEKGTLSESIARKILSVEKVAPGLGTVVAKEIAESGVTSTEAVNNRIEQRVREKGKLMWSARYKGSESTPRGGSGLWPLDWTIPAGMEPSKVKFEEFKKLYEGPEQVEAVYPSMMGDIYDKPKAADLREIFESACWALRCEMRGDQCSTWQERVAKAAPQAMDTVRMMVQPPACTACPFYLRIDGVHYCMREACWKNKKQVWVRIELERLSKELGIPIYDREVDGPCEEFTSQWSANQNAAQWFKDRVDHLRLKSSYNEYGTNYLTDSKVAAVVSVRKEIQEKKEEQKEEARKEKQIQDYEKLRREATERFALEQVYPHLKEQLLAGFHHAGAVVLMGDNWHFRELDMSNPTDPEVVDRAKQILLESKLRYGFMTNGPVQLAKKLQHELLPKWGVKISGDLVQIAKAYEIQEG